MDSRIIKSNQIKSGFEPVLGEKLAWCACSLT
jgi:hypothetical protein